MDKGTRQDRRRARFDNEPEKEYREINPSKGTNDKAWKGGGEGSWKNSGIALSRRERGKQKYNAGLLFCPCVATSLNELKIIPGIFDEMARLRANPCSNGVVGGSCRLMFVICVEKMRRG